jgi:GTPase SAR1 family protein
MVPTIGLNYSKVKENSSIWTLWDLGGQKRFREIWESYFLDIDVIVWIVDGKLQINSFHFKTSQYISLI